MRKVASAQGGTRVAGRARGTDRAHSRVRNGVMVISGWMMSGRAVKRWEPSAVVHVEHEQQNNSKTSEQQQANVKDVG